jgi:hypothetical protein
MLMRLAGWAAARVLTSISASGASRSTAVSAVITFAVLAGGSASCSFSASSTAPVSAFTTMCALGGGESGAACSGRARSSAPAGPAGHATAPTRIAVSTPRATSATTRGRRRLTMLRPG